MPRTGKTLIMKEVAMMGNMDIYNKVREVPPEAQKTITAGRLKGFTDINPMWRIKVLTEMFGPAGIGWYYEIIDKRVEDGAAGEKVAVVDINLYIKHEGEWSKPIQGTGGSMLVAKEKNGMYTSDECFKMALTDAISVACKSLGVGADVYYAKDRSKYKAPNADGKSGEQPKPDAIIEPQKQKIRSQIQQLNITEAELTKAINAKSLDDLTKQQASELIAKLEASLKKRA